MVGDLGVGKHKLLSAFNKYYRSKCQIDLPQILLSSLFQLLVMKSSVCADTKDMSSI